MTKHVLLASSALLLTAAMAAPLAAQEAPAEASNPGEIIITATKRAQALSEVPIAVSAVSAEALANSGASDVRQLNQLAPSLLVSAATSEGNSSARVRGIGTVGENPGLESSVAIFVDGVYRSRTGIGVTELGEIERIEVLRGPQGTLFGRNASAGLISIVTKKPQFEFGGTAEATYGNYDYMKFGASVTGPLVANTLAASLNAVYVKRDGFLTDAISGRDVNNRDRYLIRGQLLFNGSDDLSVRLIADYAKKSEECCAAVYLPTRNVARDASGNVVISPNSLVAFARNFGSVINENTYERVASITPGQGYRFDSKDYGVSGEVNWDLGAASLTSITAYRISNITNGQDGDYNNLDLVNRFNRQQKFKTFTQELRLQGTILDDRLDWLVGGFYTSEKLTLIDDLKFGSQLGPFLSCQLAAALGAANVSPTSPGCLNPAFRTATTPVFGSAFYSLFDNLNNMRNVGANPNSYFQDGENYALFTHNVFKITDRLSLTLGGRYTWDNKDLVTTINNNNPACGLNRVAFGQALAFAALPTTSATARATINGLGPALLGTSCASNLNTLANGTFTGSRKEDKFTGTAVLSFKATDDLLTYLSYATGYKSGGYNLDQAGFLPTATGATPKVADLAFEPETVRAYEVGAKLDGPIFRLNGAVFYQQFSDFQLNTFNGTNFIVENTTGCSDDLGGRDRDLIANNSACANTKPGVTIKGLELEASANPTDILLLTAGATYAKTKYAANLSGAGGRSFAPALFQLPGSQISNAPRYVLTGSAALTPNIGDTGLTGLMYVDFRYQSAINTGSDLDPEKIQQGFMLVNARLGIYGEGKRWGLEFWAQNLFDKNYMQIAADAPLQGSGTIGAVTRGLTAVGAQQNQAFIAFLGEPRTFGVSLKAKF